MFGVEQPHDRREHAVAVELAALQIRFDALADLGQRLAEFAAAVIFGGVLLGAIIGVIAILLAPARILAGRLDMAVGVLAEPGVDIGGGQGERVEPVDLVAVGDALCRRRNRPSRAPFPARVAGLAVIAVAQHLLVGLFVRVGD